MLWYEDVELEVVNYSDFHIHTKVTVTPNEVVGYLTGFYGAPETSKRSQSWNLLGKIDPGVNSSLCVMVISTKLQHWMKNWEGGLGLNLR